MSFSGEIHLIHSHLPWRASSSESESVSRSVLSNSFAALWTMAHQAPLSMGFFRQEYWSGLPCPSPGNSFFFLTQGWNPGLQHCKQTQPSEPPRKPQPGRQGGNQIYHSICKQNWRIMHPQNGVQGPREATGGVKGPSLPASLPFPHLDWRDGDAGTPRPSSVQGNKLHPEGVLLLIDWAIQRTVCWV